MKTSIKVIIILIVVAIIVFTALRANKPIETNNTNSSAQSQKLNIVAICEGSLAYMTFPDGDSAAKFVEECKAGEHPEVIEKYKADMGYGDDKAI